MQEDLIVPIIKNNIVSSFFVKANRHILETYKETFKKELNYDVKLDMLKKAWLKEFSAEIVFKDTTPDSIKFVNDNSKIIFFLKFGN